VQICEKRVFGEIPNSRLQVLRRWEPRVSILAFSVNFESLLYSPRSKGSRYFRRRRSVSRRDFRSSEYMVSTPLATATPKDATREITATVIEATSTMVNAVKIFALCLNTCAACSASYKHLSRIGVPRSFACFSERLVFSCASRHDASESPPKHRSVLYGQNLADPICHSH
jgi:hypothetical protein